MIEYNKQNIRSWSLLGIAPAIFINAVAQEMDNNEEINLITADTGRYCGFQKLPEKLKNRIFNCGISEQDMIGVAAGMAMEGKQVFVTTYAPFISYRSADQVRHLMGNLNLNIKAIGTAAGFSAAISGPALNAISDIAFMRSIPNMIVLQPADCTEAMKMIEAMAKISNPVYMRFCGLTNLPIVYKDDFEYEIGKANVLKTGSDIAILATGTNIVSDALKAATNIEEESDFSVKVVDFHTIKPLDYECLEQLKDCKLIVTVEEHSVIGGLGSAVTEFFGDKGKAPQILRLGVPDCVMSTGNRKYMLELCGLTSTGITEAIRKVIS